MNDTQWKAAALRRLVNAIDDNGVHVGKQTNVTLAALIDEVVYQYEHARAEYESQARHAIANLQQSLTSRREPNSLGPLQITGVRVDQLSSQIAVTGAIVQELFTYALTVYGGDLQRALLDIVREQSEDA